MPSSNDRGPIAESYQQLQSLPELKQARDAFDAPPASPESLVRTVLQAAELAMLNLRDLMARAASDLSGKSRERAVVKLSWAQGFHRLLVELSVVPQYTIALFAVDRAPGALNFRRSPAYRGLRFAIRRFDRTFLNGAAPADLERTIAGSSLDATEYRIVHLARLCSFEASVWERNLYALPAWREIPRHDEYIAAHLLRQAATCFSLSGDTYFMQFRALHQIPELLAMECADHMAAAVGFSRDSDLANAAAHLIAANHLMHVIVSGVTAMAENLATSDYHAIRENLGLTSGSHSIGLRYRLFEGAYTELAEQVAQREQENDTSALSRLVGGELRRFRCYVGLWRDMHAHLPRNNLGGNATRSLIGSPDAIEAVRQMRSEAQRRDPLRDAAELNSRVGKDPPPLTRYFASDASLDARLLAITGEITQKRFADVQNRSGYFQGRAPLVTPATQKKVDTTHKTQNTV